MITQTLQTSGGTYSTLSSAVSALVAILSNGTGLVDDITVNVEGGVSFGVESTASAFGAASVKWNGYTITFQTNPAASTPATLLGSYITNAGGGTTGFLTFKNLFMGSSHTANNAMFYEGYGKISVINCFVMYTGNVTLFSGTPTTAVTENNTLVLGAQGLLNISASRGSYTKNNIVILHTASAISTSGAFVGSYVDVYNYGVGVITISTPLAGTQQVVPLTVDQLLQAPTDTVTTVLARDAQLTGTSPCIDAGSAVQATDIIGETRATADIGAYAYIVPADFTLTTSDWVRDTTKHADAVSNYETKTMLQTDAVTADALADSGVDELWDAISAELTAEPGAEPTVREALMLLYMSLRNAETVTSTARTIKNNAGATIATATLNDDGTTFTKSNLG